MKLSVLSLLFFCLAVALFAQENESVYVEKEKNVISFAYGYTYVPKASAIQDKEANRGFFIPSIGLDYLRRVSKRMEIGIMTDLELADYLIIDRDLERNKAFVGALVMAYSIKEGSNIFFGPGYETDRHHSFFIFRLGFEHSFLLGNGGWVITPGSFYDIKYGYDAWSVAIAVGKMF